MQIEVKEIPQNEIIKLVIIQQSSYPGFFSGTEEEKKELVVKLVELTANDDVKAIGAYNKDILVGGMLYYIFDTNFHGEMIKSAGIGALAVDLLHKKEKVAQHLINYSFDITKEKNIPHYTLYPFSTKFYRNFGFGYGTPISTYCIAPEDFKEFSNKYILEYASDKDIDEIIEFYNEHAKNTNGMSKFTNRDKRRLKNLKKEKILLAKLEEKIIGYMIYSQEGINKKNNQSQKLLVHDMIYSKKDALLAFSTFFYSQKDQIDFIEITTFDNSFYHITRNINFVPNPITMQIIAHKMSETALGLMHRAIDLDYLLKLIENKTDKSVQFDVVYPKNIVTKPHYINKNKSKYIHIMIKLNEFSSFITGAETLESLYDHGQLDTETPLVLRELDYQFNFKKPISYTRF